MDDDARQIVGVTGVVRDAEGRVLLIRTKRAGWELPGGRAEQGEDLIAALRREVREEGGVELEVGRLAAVSSHLGAPGLLLLTFVCAYAGGEAVAGDDSLDVGWFAPDEALRTVTHPSELTRLRDALMSSAGVVYRAYRPGSGGGQDETGRWTI